MSNETDQLSNDSGLLTEEEEEEEEKNLDFLYKAGKDIQEYVEDIRKIKAENKKNKDHKKTGNELWVEVFQNYLSCQKPTTS